MKKIIIGYLLGLFFCLLSGFAGAQPFADEIAAFKKQDSIKAPPKHAILFVGSSSFRKWTDVQAYFPDHVIINRGFGGSTLPDMIRYVNELIFPYHPKQVVIYCGENDIAAADSITATIVLQRFKTLYTLIRKKMPAVPVLFISIKPSLLRWRLRNTMIAANKGIQQFLLHQQHDRFVSVWNAMLGEDGKPLPNIFIEDGLHMNPKGYAIWQKIIAPYLIN